MQPKDFAPIVHRSLAATPISNLLGNSEAVILERIAMGGGATRWYYCADRDRLSAIEAQLSPGSVVSFFFDGRIKKAIYCAEARLEIEKIISLEKEATIGHLCDDGFHIEVDFVAGLGDVDEFISSLDPSSLLFYGAFPARDNDGLRAVTLTIPDEDGIIRPHPH